MVHLLGLGNDSTIVLPEDSHIGDTHQRQRHYASILESYHYMTLAPPNHPKNVQKLASNFWVYPVAESMHDYILKAYGQASSIIQQYPINLVSSQDPFLVGLAAYLVARRNKLPLSIHFVADMLDNPYWLKQRPLNHLLNTLGHWLISRADTFRVVSQDEAQKLIRLGIQKEQIVTLPSITDFSRFSTSTTQRFLPDTHQTLLLCIGRFVPQKNLEMLLHAFAKISDIHPDCFLLLVGDGPQKEILLRLAHTLGIEDNMHFAGSVPYEQLPDYYAAADIFLLTSIYEGNARVLAEAAVSELTAVSTKVSGTSDTIIDGETGFVTPINDIEQFVDRVCFLLENPTIRQQMGQKARQHILTEYNTKKLLAGFRQFWGQSAQKGKNVYASAHDDPSS